MAKNNLPSVDHVKPNENDSGIPNIGDPHPITQQEGYLSTHMIDINKRADTKLNRDQALELRAKMRKLQDDNCLLMDGSPIRSKSDVIRWMIESPLAPTR